MRALAILLVVIFPACKGGPTKERKAACAAFAQREMTCIGAPEMKRGDEMYDLEYDVCIDPEADPKVTKVLVIGASMGDQLVSLEQMIACAQKPLDCDAYHACYGGQRVKRE